MAEQVKTMNKSLASSPEPTLARLSFWIAPECQNAFAAVCQEQIIPLLKRCGLHVSSKTGRPSPEGIFSLLFETESPQIVQEVRQTLREAPEWQKFLAHINDTFGSVRPDPSFMNTHDYLTIYQAPAGSGQCVVSGAGKQQTGLGEGHWKTLGVLEGLGGTDVMAITQDFAGNMWFATSGGATRYYGQDLETFTTKDGLAHNHVMAALCDRKGVLWFGTDDGISRYDGTRWYSWSQKDGLVHPVVMSIFEDRDGVLWFGTEGGVSRVEPNEEHPQFTNYTSADGLPGGYVGAILQDRDGNLWFGTSNGVCWYDGRQFHVIDGLLADRIYDLCEDQSGALWFGTATQGAICYDGQRCMAFTAEDGLASNFVKTIYQEEDGVFWFGTVGGLTRYDASSGVWKTFTSADGLAHEQVSDITKDHEGHLWFATLNGVSQYAGHQFTTFTQTCGLANEQVQWILEDRGGKLWFATRGGVSCFDGQTWTSFTEADGLAQNDVYFILEDRHGHLWFATYGGVSCYNGQTWTTFTKADGLAHNEVRWILEDRFGGLWFASWNGRSLSCYDGETWRTFDAADGLPHRKYWSLAEDSDGYLYLATNGGGICRFENPEHSPDAMLSPTRWTRADGLSDDLITSISKDQAGGLWLSSPDGAVRYDGESFAILSRTEGLVHNHIRYIFEDRSGGFWFSTYGAGVSHCLTNPAEEEAPVFQHLSVKDGLGGNTVWCILQDRAGHYWFGTNGGATRWIPFSSSPKIAIEAIVTDQRYGPQAEISVSSNPGMIAFEFQGCSLKTQPGAIVYRYCLEGYDLGWKSTQARRVEYQNLEPRDYTFQILAVDRDLSASDPATVQVSVTPDPHIHALTEALSVGESTNEFVGISAALQQVQSELAQVATTDVTVWIQGETGTGKGLAARAVHALSERRAGPFISVNCGAIPEGLVESELFGHERGAFTGAVALKLGKVELAEAGTLFLDEIGDLALDSQAKLLRLLEERTFERVGGTKTLTADVRVVAATNRDLTQMVAEKLFREDLYYRLNTFPVTMPPLRERREDIALLATYFMERMAHHLNKRVSGLSPEAKLALVRYDWPGNVRELEHVVQRAVIVCRGQTVKAKDIALGVVKDGGTPLEEALVTLEDYDRRYIQKVLETTGWVIRGPNGAATILGMHEATLRNMTKCGMD